MDRVEERIEPEIVVPEISVPEIVVPEIVVEVRGEIGSDLAGYARERMAEVLVHTGPVLRVHVRVVRHGDPARENPITAHANVDLDGKPVVVHAAAAKPRAAVDLLVERMRHRLERIRRDRRPHHRQGSGRTAQPPVEPEIIRHATSSPTPCSVDEAVVEMDDLGLDFHLFVEISTGQDAVVYHAGPTGLRLTRSGGGSAPVGPHSVAVTVSAQPAPLLATAEAVERMRITGLPFLFYLDADHQRANVLYYRDDGDYGLIDPAAR